MRSARPSRIRRPGRMPILKTSALCSMHGRSSAGALLMEYGDPAAVTYLASARKSVLSMLFGTYVANGTVRLDRRWRSWASTTWRAPGAEQQATVRTCSRRVPACTIRRQQGDDLATRPRAVTEARDVLALQQLGLQRAGHRFEIDRARHLRRARDATLRGRSGCRTSIARAQRKAGDSTRSRHLAYHMNLSTRDMARLGL